jgi:glutamate-ammonia-ligase adenylyltransferase
LVTLMEARDADGYVFRTDLRLRPDPASTPPAISIGAALSYYESMGQNWERAAMIKARPVAGDLALGAGFLGEIRPFVWRRGLDFAAVADIHAMRRRIDAHRGGALDPTRAALARIAGHNIKLGEGGIREIEFLTQTLQLVWGGRDPGLRDPTTLGALTLLTRAGLVAEEARAELTESYAYLRRLEHRLQMINDRQTHDVPAKAEELDRVAIFMGRADASEFAGELLGHLGRVRARYAEVFTLLPEGDAALEATLDFQGDGPAPDATVSALSALGFTAPDRIVAAVRAWQAGRVRALRSERARDLLTIMLPSILSRLAELPDPDASFARFDRFLTGLPTGVQPLSLFEHNRGLLDRVAAVLGAAPRLAEHMARVPNALEGLLTDEPARAATQRLRARLRDARVLEDCIETTRLVVKEVDFAISVATLEGRLDADAAGLRRSALADAALGGLLRPVLRDFESRYGRVRGGGMVVVALGKAGGREMMANSDLDLMLIYDHPVTETESRGARGMPVSQWFVRAAHAFVAAVTAPGIDGPLYAVDMRLRPSGNKGPVAVSLASFRRYHAEDAWTWERMALTRARVVAGPVALRRLVEAAIAEARAGARGNALVRADALAMRRRMLRDLPADGPWDMKLRAGGLIEVEFIAQALRLYHAPATKSGSTRDMLAALAAMGGLEKTEAATLIRADRLWRGVQGLLRLTVGHWTREALPEASLRPVLRVCQALGVDVVDLAGLRAILDNTARDVRAIFERRIGEIEA